MAIRIIHKVSEDELAEVEEEQWTAGATEVDARPDGDRNYTVVAIFPDKEAHTDLKARVAARQTGP